MFGKRILVCVDGKHQPKALVTATVLWDTAIERPVATLSLDAPLALGEDKYFHPGPK
jgi:hypothetical protein